MNYEAYIRICVGLPLEAAATQELGERFLASLGLPADAPRDAVFARLREDTPRHKLHEADRLRYELAFEAFVDGLWDVDCAIGGVSTGVLDPARGYVFVGVRVEDIERTVRDDMPALAARPKWLHKGDLTAGSDLVKELGPDARKAMVHAARMYQRAGKEILNDAHKRLRVLPVSRQHDPDWALVRWLVPA